MLTQHSKNDNLASVITFPEMHQRWLSCPNPQIADLFDYGTAHSNTRVLTYILDEVLLQQLFDHVNNTAINFRIHMAANPDIAFGMIEEAPSFTPIIQLFNTNSPPANISENSVLPDFCTSSSHVLTKISHEKADMMIKGWKDYLKAGLPNLFEIEGVRINFTTFDKSDSDEIRAVFNLPAVEKTLFVHLGYEIPTESAKPFGFRIVLEVLASFSDPSLEVRKYFEFSNPCPPAC